MTEASEGNMNHLYKLLAKKLDTVSKKHTALVEEKLKKSEYEKSMGGVPYIEEIVHHKIK